MPKKKGAKQKRAAKNIFHWGELLQAVDIDLGAAIIKQRDAGNKTIWQAIAEAEQLSAAAHQQIAAHVKSLQCVKTLNAILPGKGCSALGLAIKTNNFVGVSTLIQLGADICSAFADDRLGLHAILRHMSNPDEILKILAHLSERNTFTAEHAQQDSTQRCVYDYALITHADEGELSQQLLKMGIKPLFDLQGKPLAMWLLDNDKLDLLDIFLPHLSPQQVYTCDSKGANGLFSACFAGDIELVKSLLSVHPYPGTLGLEKQNALHIIALVPQQQITTEHERIFELLLRLGVDPNQVDIRGNTPLMVMLDNAGSDFLIQQLIKISNLHQININQEHCLNLAICNGQVHAAEKIIEQERSLNNRPFLLEYEQSTFQPEFIEQVKTKRVTESSHEKAKEIPGTGSATTAVLLAYYLHGDKMLKIMQELICFNDENGQWVDDPYRAALSVDSSHLVYMLVKHGVPIQAESRKAVKECTDKLHRGFFKLIDDVNQKIKEGDITKALMMAKVFPLHLLPIYWMTHSEFQEYWLLACLEHYNHKYGLELLYVTIKKQQLSAYINIDDSALDGEIIPVRIGFFLELKHFLMRLEQIKINHRCNEQQKRELESFGFKTNPKEQMTGLSLSDEQLARCKDLIRATDLTTATAYDCAKAYWKNVLITVLGCSEGFRSEDLSLVELFIRRFEYDQIEARLSSKLTRDGPQGMVSAFMMLSQLSTPESRIRLMRSVNEQIIANRAAWAQGITGRVSGLLYKEKSADPTAKDWLVDEVNSAKLSDEQIMAIATRVLASLRNQIDLTPTAKSQQFFAHITKIMLTGDQIVKDISLLNSWLMSNDEHDEWLKQPAEQSQLLCYLSDKYQQDDCRAAVMAVLDSVVTKLGKEVFEHNHQHDLDRVEIIQFLCQPEVLLRIQQDNECLYSMLCTYPWYKIFCSGAGPIRVSDLSENSNAEIVQLKEQVKGLLIESDDLNRIIKQQEKQLAEIEKAQMKMDKSSQHQREVAKLTAKLDSQQSSHDVASAKLKKENEQLKQELQRLKSQADADEKDHAGAVAETAQLKKELQQHNAQQSAQIAINAKLEAANIKLRGQQDLLQLELDKSRGQVDASEAAHAQAVAETAQLQNELQQLKTPQAKQSIGGIDHSSAGAELRNAQTNSKADHSSTTVKAHEPTESCPRHHTVNNLFGASGSNGGSPEQRGSGEGVTANASVMAAAQLQAFSGAGSGFEHHPNNLLLARYSRCAELYAALAFSAGVASYLSTTYAGARVCLGGSLALALARNQAVQQSAWVNAAKGRHEDIDIYLFTLPEQHSTESIKNNLLAWAKQRNPEVHGPCVKIRGEEYDVEIHLNKNYKAYADAIMWDWKTTDGGYLWDWNLDLVGMRNAYPHQYNFIFSNKSLQNSGGLDGIPESLHYSLFWSLAQLVKHKYYELDLTVCQYGLSKSYSKVQYKRAIVTKALHDIMMRFSEGIFWPTAVQVLLNYDLLAGRLLSRQEKPAASTTTGGRSGRVPRMLVDFLRPAEGKSNHIQTARLESAKTYEQLCQRLKSQQGPNGDQPLLGKARAQWAKGADTKQHSQPEKSSLGMGK